MDVFLSFSVCFLAVFPFSGDFWMFSAYCLLNVFVVLLSCLCGVWFAFLFASLFAGIREAVLYMFLIAARLG